MASIFNFGYLKALVLKKLQGDTFFGEEDIEDALNEGQDDLAVFTLADLTSTPLALVAGQDTYDWPANALAVNGVNINGIELDEITQEEWRRYGGLSPFNVGQATTPTAYAIQGKKIILFPKPGNAALPAVVFLVPKPTDLDLDTDVPVVARTFTQAWVYFAVYRLLENDAARHAESLYHFNMYKMRRAEHAVKQNTSRKRKFRNIPPRGYLS